MTLYYLIDTIGELEPIHRDKSVWEMARQMDLIEEYTEQQMSRYFEYVVLCDDIDAPPMRYEDWSNLDRVDRT